MRLDAKPVGGGPASFLAPGMVDVHCGLYAHISAPHSPAAVKASHIELAAVMHVENLESEFPQD
jgi:hypothetical protein